MRPLQGNRRNVITLTLLAGLMLSVGFLLAPMPSVSAARRALAARLSASPTVQKIVAIAPAPVRRVVNTDIVGLRTAAALLGSPTSAAANVAEVTAAPVFVGITFDGSPGTAAPPPTLGPYTMTPFPNDPRPTAILVTTVPAPATFPVGSSITFSNPLEHDKIGDGWGSWSHGYLGDVYDNVSNGPQTSVTITLPPFTGAFYFYAEPNSAAAFTVQATADDGTTSGPIPVVGAAGARYFGFYSDGSVSLVSILINVEAAANGFAVGEFGIARLGGYADLEITKIGNVASVTAGAAGAAGQITYGIGYNNNGIVSAFGTRIVDNIPAGLTPVGTITAPGLSCNGLVPNSGAQIACIPLAGAFGANAAAELPVGASGAITFTLAVPAAYLLNSVTNSITISSDTPDGNSPNNTASDITQVTHAADLAVTKTSGNPTPVAGGAAFAYTITVTNNGPSNAQNVLVNDPLPAGIIFFNALANSGFVCAGPPVGTNGVVQCTNANFAPGVATIMLTVGAAANQAGGVSTNTATATSATPDPGPGANSDSVLVTRTNNASLTITKSATVSACAGDNVSYLISVVNTGNSSAVNTVVTDVLPANTSFVSVIGTGPFAGACNFNGGTGTLTCNAVFVPQGAHTITLVVKTSPATPSGALSNSASLVSAVPPIGPPSPPNPPPLVATDTTDITHCIDLQTTKTATPNPVAPGQNLTYTINVENLGPSDAGVGEYRVIENNPFPPTGTTLVGTISAPGFDCNGGISFPCLSNAPLPAGASVPIKFTVNLNSDFAGSQITNQANASAFGPNAGDPNTINNTSTVTTQVVPSADLSITKSALTVAGGVFGAAVTAGGAVLPGFGIGTVGLGEIEYTLSYFNNGPSNATNVHIRDVIPAGTLLVPTFLPVGVIVTPIVGPSLTCQILPTLNEYQLDCTPNTASGVLPAGSAGTIQFSVRVPENIAGGSVIKNQTTINSEGTPPQPGFASLLRLAGLAQQIPATPDPSGGNNTSLETQNIVRASADLAITKAGPATITAGQGISYTLAVTNNGISDARDIVVKDTIPGGLTFTSAQSNDADVSCSTSGLSPVVVTCQQALLAAPPSNPPPIIPPRNENTSFTITIFATVSPGLAEGAVINNTATVETSTEDPVLGNNTSNTVATTVSSQATVTIAKIDNPDPVVAGQNINYVLAVQNAGPSVARDVVVTDTLPANTTFVNVNGQGPFGGPACAHNGAVPGAITCTATSPLNPGLTTINLNVRVNPDFPGTTVTNTATVVWSNSPGTPPDPDTANGTADTTVNRVTNLFLDKSHDSGSVIAGTPTDFTIRVNNGGPSDILGGAVPGSLVVTDTLPAGASLVSYTVAGPGGFVCTEAPPGTVTCLNAAGAPGNIPAGSGTTIILKILSPSNAPNGSNFCNTATVAIGGGEPLPHPPNQPTDPNPTNNTDTACAVVTTSADLATAKTSTPVVDPDGAGPLVAVPLPVVGPNVPPGAVNAGGYLRYDVPFGNSGPSDAVNVMLSNVIPGNTAFVGALATGGVFVPAAQPPAVPFVFSITAADGVPATPDIGLTCTVIGAAGTQQMFCRPQGNGALVPPFADGTLPAGYSGLLTFFVKVNESVSGGTVITDPAIITSGLCPNVAPPTFPPVPCTATADPNASNNTSQTTQNVVVASSNLQVTKIVQSGVTSASNPNQTGPIGPATLPNGVGLTGTAVLPGTVMTYRVVITNNGPSDVSNIRLTDVLPSGLETPPGRVLGVKYISITPVLPSGATFTCNPPTGINPANNPQGNGGSIVCTAPSLAATPPNNTAAIDIVVFIDPATKASLVNTATVDATLNNFNQPVSGTATLTTPVAPQAEVAVSKTYTPNPVIAGLPFTYSIVLTNNGPSTATAVSLTDTFPPFQKVTNIAIQTTQNGNGAPNFTCATVPVLGSPGNTTSMNCIAPELPPNKNADNTVSPSGTVTFVLTMLQDQATPQPLPVPYQNCLTSTSATTDVIPANNTLVCIPVNVIFQADPDTVTLQKVDVPDPVIAGNLLTYTITGVNNGPSAALDYRITDPLPIGTVFISAVASPGATLVTPAINANGVVTATWDAAGGTPAGLTLVGVTRTLTIVVRVCAEVVCGTLSNTATSSSLTNDVRVDNDSFTATTTVQAQSDLSISKTDFPDPAKPSFGLTDQFVTYTINFANAGPSNSANTIITDVLPAGFTVFGTPTSTVPGTVFSQSVGGPQGDQVTVTANLGVLGAANQCNLPARPTSGTIVIVARVPNKFPNVTVTNTATITTGNCLPDPNLANNTAIATTVISEEPQGGSAGLGFPAEAEASDDKSGSVLFWPLYTSNASTPALQNTSISLTNKSIFDSATVHLFVVDGTTCSAQDVYICLTPNQTVSFLASDFDPGVTGYIVAIAVNINTGRPVSLNCLMGDAYVKFASGHRAAYGAVAVSTVLNNPTGVDPLATTAVLRFDGASYNRLPRILALDGIPAIGDANSTMISVMAVGGNMSLTGATIGSLTGNMFDDRENNFSFNEPAPQCQFTRVMNDSFPRTFTPFSGLILPGHTGWMKIRAFQDIGILGVMLNVNTNAATAGNAFNSGHSLHGLTLTGNSTLTIPVDIPECH